MGISSIAAASGLSQTAVGAQVAGGLASAVGSTVSALSQKNAYEFSSSMAELNAQQAELGYKSAVTAGQQAEEKSMIQTAQLKSKQTTAMAANGLDLSEGSPLNVLTTTDVMGKIDQNTIKANAVMAAFGYKTQETNSLIQAKMASASAGSISAPLSTATSLLTSASNVAGKWYQASRAGVFGSSNSTSVLASNTNSDWLSSIF
jgi:hypothetical protein